MRSHTEFIASAPANTRFDFLLLTYTHLLFAICAFVSIEAILFYSGIAQRMAVVILSVNWLLPLGAYILVGCFAAHTAKYARSLSAQYFGLALFVLAEAIIFVPLLYLAQLSAPGVLSSAALITLIGFGLLSGVVYLTAADFSFLRGIILWAGSCALLLIIGACLFGFHLGTWFSVAMIALAGACVLYDTSNILHHYKEDQYVAASLELFSSVALMFWYVVQLLMDLS